MSANKLIPIDFSRNITPFIIGDELGHDVAGFFTLNLKSQVEAFNIAHDHDNEYFVVSFADRPNTGTQPVGDDVVVDVLYSTGFPVRARSDYFNWSLNIANAIKSWKQNHEAMLKQYQAEQGEKHHIEIQTKANGEPDNLDFVINEDKAADDDVVSEKPVYTQEMANASNLPKCNADCRYKLIGGVNWFDCRVISYHKNYAWIENLTTGSLPLIKINTLLFAPHKPIKTVEEKLRDAIIDTLKVARFTDMSEGAALNFDADNFLSSDKFTITLNG